MIIWTRREDMTHEEMDLDQIIEDLEAFPSSVVEKECILKLTKIIREIKEGFDSQFYFGREDF